MLDMRKCYIRRDQQPWVEGLPHHHEALQLYMDSYVNRVEPGLIPQTATIQTPHVHGGDFVASFSYVNHVMYQYVDEYDNTVYIMMQTPEQIAFINRISD